MTPSASRFWQGRKVFVTGHMGFKGAWLSCLLSRLGAQTTGFGYDERWPLLYRELAISNHSHNEGDVRDVESLSATLQASEASIVFHLAAQPIVLVPYQQPVRTFEDNVMGTVNVLEAVRRSPAVEAAVIVTSDKVYRNDECARPYREDDPLGGCDPYSASKAAAEIVTKSMIASFFTGPDGPRVATARAGNVIGGGDWAEYRLLPDAARALSQRQPLLVRNPRSTRPWQHVLEPLNGYLTLAQALSEGRDGGHSAWNFGPAPEDALRVAEVADLFVSTWGEGAIWHAEEAESGTREATFLSVDTTLAQRELGWRPRWRVAEAVTRTAAWYKEASAGQHAASLLDRDIDAFLSSRESTTYAATLGV